MTVMAEERDEKKQDLPLCVDLDGTLVRTDTLVELMILLIKQDPLYLFRMIRWLGHGLVFFKKEVSQRVSLAVDDMPYTRDLVKYIKQERAGGRLVYLVTASHSEVARVVADHLGLFDGVIASQVINLKGQAKAEALVKRFGEQGFVYAGNSMADVAVWRVAKAGIVTCASRRVTQAAQKVARIEKKIIGPVSSGFLVCRMLRCHQWAKNILLLVPLVMSHAFVDLARLQAALIAVVAFSLAASAIYIMNDLADVGADRKHPRKSKRPFAAGEVMPQTGILSSVGLILSSIVLALLVSKIFLWWMVGYMVLTILYSFYLKRIVLVDVVVLALLYTIRVFAGAAAVAVPVTGWLMVFSLFIFMSLALLKRFVELQRMQPTQQQEAVPGRGYMAVDSGPVGQLGATSGYLSVLVFGLYIRSPQVLQLYSRPNVLWLFVPVLLYWISRMWLLGHRGELDEDPIVFTLRDRISYLAATCGIVLFLLAL